ncbi:MAG: hypothetical protein WC872_01750 [Candidatus Absconditabacterales bacterium]
MKKLLYGIIMLFGVFTFFGVNNFSFAANGQQCKAKTGVLNHYYTCQYKDKVPSSCLAGTQSCLKKEDCNGTTMCCICDPDPTITPPTPPTIQTGNCNSNNDCRDDEECVSYFCQKKTTPANTVPGNNNTSSLCGGKTCDGTTHSCVQDKCVCDPNITGNCCGIKLNTNVPFIGNCIELSSQNPKSNINESTAFPILMGGLTKILITVILVVCFGVIIVGGVMISTGGASQENVTQGRKLIMGVVKAIAILGAIGVILRLINPNFFG